MENYGKHTEVDVEASAVLQRKGCGKVILESFV